VDDDRVWLLYTQEMINATNDMLHRLWKANLEGVGKVPYRLYIEILEGSLKLEDYKDYGKELIGFRTACKIQEEHLQELWKQCYKLKK